MTRSRWELIRDNWWYEPRPLPVLALSEQLQQAIENHLNRSVLTALLAQNTPVSGIWEEPGYYPIPNLHLDMFGNPVLWGPVQVSRI